MCVSVTFSLSPSTHLSSCIFISSPSISFRIRNLNRAAGTLISSTITSKHGGAGLPPDTLTINFQGTAGQSFGAFLAKGMFK